MKQTYLELKVEILDLPLIGGQIATSQGTFINLTILIEDGGHRIMIDRSLGAKVLPGISEKELHQYGGSFKFNIKSSPEIPIKADFEEVNNKNYQMIIGTHVLDQIGVLHEIVLHNFMKLSIPKFTTPSPN